MLIALPSLGVGYLAGVTRAVSGRRLQEPEPASQQDDDKCGGAIRMLSRMLNLKTGPQYQIVQKWMDAHPLRATFFGDNRTQMAHAQPGLPKQHPLVQGRVQLQESFVAFHNFMWLFQMLPISQWGHRRSSADMDKSNVGRLGFSRYFERSAWMVPPGSMCLSWEEKHAARIPACDPKRIWVLRYKGAAKPKKHQGSHSQSRVEIDAAHRVLFADLVAAAERPEDLGEMRSAFDLIVCNQVFEHVKQPFKAARTLYHLLRPGGLVFWSAPFLERFHLSFESHDFFRYTVCVLRMPQHARAPCATAKPAPAPPR